MTKRSIHSTYNCSKFQIHISVVSLLGGGSEVLILLAISVISYQSVKLPNADIIASVLLVIFCNIVCNIQSLVSVSP